MLLLIHSNTWSAKYSIIIMIESISLLELIQREKIYILCWIKMFNSISIIYWSNFYCFSSKYVFQFSFYSDEYYLIYFQNILNYSNYLNWYWTYFKSNVHISFRWFMSYSIISWDSSLKSSRGLQYASLIISFQ
jgi:hypothetical protein